MTDGEELGAPASFFVLSVLYEGLVCFVLYESFALYYASTVRDACYFIYAVMFSLCVIYR